MSEELKDVVTEQAVEAVEEVVANKAAEGFQLNDLEAAGIFVGAVALGYCIARVVDKVKAKMADKAEAEELEKKGFFGKIFHKSKKVAKVAAEEFSDITEPEKK